MITISFYPYINHIKRNESANSNFMIKEILTVSQQRTIRKLDWNSDYIRIAYSDLSTLTLPGALRSKDFNNEANVIRKGCKKLECTFVQKGAF